MMQFAIDTINEIEFSKANYLQRMNTADNRSDDVAQLQFSDKEKAKIFLAAVVLSPLLIPQMSDMLGREYMQYMQDKADPNKCIVKGLKAVIDSLAISGVHMPLSDLTMTKNLVSEIFPGDPAQTDLVYRKLIEVLGFSGRSQIRGH